VLGLKSEVRGLTPTQDLTPKTRPDYPVPQPMFWMTGTESAERVFRGNPQ